MMIYSYPFKYGLQYRPPMFGAIPKVFYEYDPNYRDRSRNINFGVIYTERELTAHEINVYELVDLNERMK